MICNFILMMLSTFGGLLIWYLMCTHKRMVVFPPTHKIGLWLVTVGHFGYAGINIGLITGAKSMALFDQASIFLVFAGLWIIVGSTVSTQIQKEIKEKK